MKYQKLILQNTVSKWAGTGKTWVLLALLVWQYFNAQINERPHSTVGESKDWYSDRFLVVAPGREVLDRLLDAFKGR
jgi:type III restriction enzyme